MLGIQTIRLVFLGYHFVRCFDWLLVSGVANIQAQIPSANPQFHPEFQWHCRIWPKSFTPNFGGFIYLSKWPVIKGGESCDLNLGDQFSRVTWKLVKEQKTRVGEVFCCCFKQKLISNHEFEVQHMSSSFGLEIPSKNTTQDFKHKTCFHHLFF